MLCMMLASFVIAFIAGVRNPLIGTDTMLYVFPFFNVVHLYDSFSALYKFEKDWIDVEYLYVVWNYAIATLTNKFELFLCMTHALMYGSFFLAAYIQRKKIILWLFVFIFCFCFFRESLNTMRQSIALGFCLIAFSYLINDKLKSSLLWIAIAYGFHHTAFIFLVVCLLWLVSKKYWKILNKRKMKIILVGLMFVFLESLALVVNTAESIGIVDDRYGARYLTEDVYGTNLPISLLALNIVNLIVFYTIKKRNKAFGIYICFFEYILIISLLFCFSGLISTFAVRMGSYFLYLSLIIFPFMYQTYVSSKLVKSFHMTFLVIYWIMTVIIANLGHTYPYSSLFLGI